MYFAPYIATDGVHMPTYQDRMEGLLESYKAIFGADVALTVSSPDYQLLSVFARALDDLTQMILVDFVSRNPQYASGTGLDLLMPLFGLARQGATHSTALLTLRGTPGAVLAAVPQVLDENGHIWACQAAGITLDAEGTATVEAICQDAGAISAPAGAIHRLVSPVSGLASAVNPAAATAGLDAETDASCRNRLRLAAAAPAVSTLEAMRSALLAVANVQSCAVYENATDAADDRGIPAHAICAVVSGGLTADLAPVIFAKKAPGIGTYGNISAEVTDAFGDSHTVRFQRAQMTVFTLAVELTPLAGFDESVTEKIRAALKAYADGLQVGQDLVVPSLYGVCYEAAGSYPPAFAITLLTASCMGEATGGVLQAAWNQRYTTQENMIQILVK